MRRAWSSLSWLILGLVLSSPLPAQDVSCLQRTLSLNVIDSQRRLIRLSDPSYFAGKFRGKPVKILSVKPDERPHRIILLLDASGSMLGQPNGRKWQMARFAAAHLAKANLPNTSLALLIFSDRVNEQIDFSQGAPAIARRLSEIAADTDYAKRHVRGTTALLDTIRSALRLLADPGFSDSIYVITDGGDNRSRTRMQVVRNALVNRRVRFYFSLLASESPGLIPTEEQTGPGEFADLAGATGGFVLGPLGVTPLGRVRYDLTQNELRGIATGLDGLYMAMTRNDLVEIELPPSGDKWSKWLLELSPEKKALHKDWLVVYPRELAPCSAGTNAR